MDSMNYSNARAQLSMLMDKAIGGHPIEITRRGRESAVIISKASYEAYKKAELEAKFPSELNLNCPQYPKQALLQIAIDDKLNTLLARSSVYESFLDRHFQG